MAQKVEQLRGCHVARTISGNSPFIVYMDESNTVDKGVMLVPAGCLTRHGMTTSTGLPKAGAMVFMSASGAGYINCFPAVTLATDADAAASNLLGLLLEDCSGAGRVAIAAAVPDNVFETAILSSAATTTATTDLQEAGYSFDASVNASKFYLNRLEASGYATGLSSSSPFLAVDTLGESGTYNGRVQFVCRYSIWTGKTSPAFT